MKSMLIAVLALALAACASQGTTTASDAPRKAEKEYRVGSNIPMRDGVSSSPTAVAPASAVNPALPPKM